MCEYEEELDSFPLYHVIQNLLEEGRFGLECLRYEAVLWGINSIKVLKRETIQTWEKKLSFLGVVIREERIHESINASLVFEKFTEPLLVRDGYQVIP